MPVVTMPDGTPVNMPDTLTPEQIKQLKALQEATHKPGPDPKDVLGFAKESGLAMVRGAGQGVIGLAGMVPALGQAIRRSGVQETANKQLDELIPKQEGYWYRGMEGLGGGALGGPQGGLRGLGVNMLSGAAGNLAAEGANEGLKDQNPLVRQIGSALAGLTAGAGVGFGLAAKQTPAQANIRAALQGADFPAAQQNIGTFAGAGSRTATAAEAFPDQNQLLALAVEARNNAGGEALKNRTAGRTQDLQNLGEEFLNRVGPPVNPNVVANEVSDAANANIQNLRDLRGDALTNRLRGEKVPPSAVSVIYRDLIRQARQSESPEVQEAYRTVAQQLVKPNGIEFITDLQTLSLQLKRLKENPPALTASAGRAINSRDLSTALTAAEQHLARVSKPFREGMEEFRDFSRQVVTPAQEGTMGKLADRNPNVAAPTPASRLDAITRDQGPAISQGGPARNPISATMFDLGDSSILGNKAVDKQKVARALLQRQLQAGSTSPGTQVRGLPGSQLDQNLDALLTSSGVNPATAKQPLEAADLLQNFQGAPGTGGNRPQSLVDSLARPLRAIGMRASGQSQEKYFEEISSLLANPTPEALRKLQEIAMFDPAVRRALTVQGAIAPLLLQQGGQ